VAPRRNRVLVVEDDDATRTLLVEILTDDGYETREASDGRQALILMRHWRPDVIILDLVMPNMDGWFFRAQQQHLPALRDVPVVVTSARRPPWREEDLMNPAAYLPKPFALEDLLSVVRRSLACVTTRSGDI
jgi:two-component system, chemotaxis family, chemotaxis protein CheY